MKLKHNIAGMKAYQPGKTAFGAEKLSSNENSLGPSKKAMDAITQDLQNLHRYPDGRSPILRDRLANDWGVLPENLIIGNGSDEVFSLLTLAWLYPDENAISARQTFSQYRYAVRLAGAQMREADLDVNGKFDLQAISSLMDSKTRMIFICNPNNPTGTYLTHKQIADFLEFLPKDVILVMDETYADFANADDFPDSKALVEQHHNLVVTRTFSKIYGLAGLRIGYGISGAEIALGAERASMPFKVNSLAQVGALAALDDEEHRQAILQLVHAEKVFFAAQLDGRKISFFPTQANFICFDIRRPVSEVWEKIARRGIAVRDLNSFGLPQMIRFTFGTRESNTMMLSIMDDILEL